MNRQLIASLLASLFLSMHTPYAYGYSLTRFNDAPAQTHNITHPWKGKRVAFLGDSITDKRRVGTKKCYWEYLTEMFALTPYIYVISGHQMHQVYGQSEKLLSEHADSVYAINIFAGTYDYYSVLSSGIL